MGSPSVRLVFALDRMGEERLPLSIRAFQFEKNLRTSSWQRNSQGETTAGGRRQVRMHLRNIRPRDAIFALEFSRPNACANSMDPSAAPVDAPANNVERWRSVRPNGPDGRTKNDSELRASARACCSRSSVLGKSGPRTSAAKSFCQGSCGPATCTSSRPFPKGTSTSMVNPHQRGASATPV